MSVLNSKNPTTKGILRLTYKEPRLHQNMFQNQEEELLSIGWNRGGAQEIWIDGTAYTCPANSVVALVANQNFELSVAKDWVLWQFNRPFYCIVDHDKEVSCAGLLFYGLGDQPFVQLDENSSRTLELLLDVFKDEFENTDNLQEDMLRMLLKRLIIKVTRWYKQQTNLNKVPVEELDAVRQFSLLVEQHYKEWHQVQDYANEMHKSPKTLSNLFAQQHSKSPLKVLHERIILEAKRLLLYTDNSIKEVAFELGFEEVPPFNRLFKKITQQTPSAFRKESVVPS